MINDLEHKVFNILLENGEYYYSSDMSVRMKEQAAVNNLEAQGLIKVTLKTIGYVLADALQT